jgi:hypothetical protein
MHVLIKIALLNTYGGLFYEQQSCMMCAICTWVKNVHGQESKQEYYTVSCVCCLLKVCAVHLKSQKLT